jgi:hypothetical protein
MSRNSEQTSRWSKIKQPLLGTIAAIPLYFVFLNASVFMGYMSPNSVAGSALSLWLAGIAGSVIFNSKFPVYFFLVLAAISTLGIFLECGFTLVYPCES